MVPIAAPDLTLKILAISCPSRRSLLSERALRSARAFRRCAEQNLKEKGALPISESFSFLFFTGRGGSFLSQRRERKEWGRILGGQRRPSLQFYRKCSEDETNGPMWASAPTGYGAKTRDLKEKVALPTTEGFSFFSSPGAAVLFFLEEEKEKNGGARRVDSGGRAYGVGWKCVQNWKQQPRPCGRGCCLRSGL